MRNSEISHSLHAKLETGVSRQCRGEPITMKIGAEIQKNPKRALTYRYPRFN